RWNCRSGSHHSILRVESRVAVGPKVHSLLLGQGVDLRSNRYAEPLAITRKNPHGTTHRMLPSPLSLGLGLLTVCRNVGFSRSLLRNRNDDGRLGSAARGGLDDELAADLFDAGSNAEQAESTGVGNTRDGLRRVETSAVIADHNLHFARLGSQRDDCAM